MNKKVFHTLEFDKIVDRLCELASSDKGKIYCEKLTPITDIDKINARQTETADAFSRITRDGNISFSGVKDITPFKKRLEIGGTLNMSEFLTIGSLLSTAKTAISYNLSSKEADRKDTLSDYFNSLSDCESLRREISRTILSEDEIADDATPELRSIRRKIGGFSDKIRSEMSRLLAGKARDFLQDSVITERDGRYCLPVKAEFKSQVPGIVHDQSSSGQTLFIEPISVVKMDNELKELFAEEKKEINRYLAELSAKTYEHLSEIEIDYRVLSELDFIFAKAYLAEKMNAVKPVLNTDGRINLRKARHPLLNIERVVPIDVNLGIDFNQLIITGPNTGGKTVTLKTVGLLTLMAQAGLHIPAGDRSEMAVFHNVYADIGDEQSIEQSLSTFSGHMTNVVNILRSVEQSGKESLVLFDELCAGTDPTEGSALATSILDELHREGIRVLATTHYSELKIYALSTEGVENASCEFSVETLSPTYRLLIGIPGKSNAFAISRKLGLPEGIIEDAKELISKEDQSFEDMISDLESKRISIEETETRIKRDNEEIAKLRAELEAEKQKIKAQKASLLEEAHKDAARILKEAKDEADSTIKTFRKLKASNPDLSEMEALRTGLSKKLNKAQSSTSKVKPQTRTNNSIKASDLHIGDTVKVLSMNLTGTVHSLPDKKNELMVSMGIMRSKVKLNDIEIVKEEDAATKFRNAKRKQATHTFSGGNAMSISPELKLLGLTVNEAISKLDKYIDDAYIAHLKSVRIVHGKGTGALRKAVQDYLATNAYVKSYDKAAYGEGDDGVTVVKLF